MDAETSYALFDVREQGEYNAGQIFSATSLPRRQIEFRLADFVPDPRIPVIVYDEGGERAGLAASTMTRLGYEKVCVLDGGLPAWRASGYATVSGVNVPSKAFGEKLYEERKVPDITVEKLKNLIEQKENLMILDVRTPEEYGRFCIPGGLNVPGGDVILWAEGLKRQTDTTVIVNCAGRTRSIVATAGLRRLGVTNVHALRNGTMGWVLAGLELETRPSRPKPAPPLESKERAKELAAQVAREEKIQFISVKDFPTRRADRGSGVLYAIDVRSEEEFKAGHIPGSLGVPGGQAVQRADDFIAVRNAAIVFISGQGTRAVMAAYWYRQMGFRDVSVLDGGIEAWVGSGQSIEAGLPAREPDRFEEAKKSVTFVDASELRRRLQVSRPVLLDVGTSLEFEQAHLPGARWLSRGWLEPKIPSIYPDRARPIVMSCADGRNSVLASRTLEEMGYTAVSVLEGGVRAWVAAGFSTEHGLEGCLMPPDDVVLSPSIRGDKEAMRRYLEWEVELGKESEKPSGG